MIYTIIFNVVDSEYKTIDKKIITEDLDNPKVKDIKTLINNGEYLNIKQEFFIPESETNILDDEFVVTITNLSYTIVLN